MSQLHFYVPDELERQIREQAEKAKLPLSRFLAELVKREVAPQAHWPEGYFDQVFGKWEGESLRRESEGAYEERTAFE